MDLSTFIVSLLILLLTYIYFAPNPVILKNKIWAYIKILQWRKLRKLNEIKFEEETENMFPLVDNNFDSIAIWATSSDLCSLHIKFTRFVGRKAEIALLMKFPDGSIYQLPNSPDTMIFDANSQSWSGGNLKLILLEPFMRWRILFNGPMVRVNRHENKNKKVYVKLNFIWIAASDPMRVPDDYSNKLLINCMESKCNSMENIQEGYDQFGNLTGIINIDQQIEPTSYSLVGIKKRRWGLDYSTFIENSLTLIGVAIDGIIYVLESNGKEDNSCCFGFIRKANGETASIDWTDLNVSQLRENCLMVNLKELKITVKAEKEKLVCKINFDEDSSHFFRGGRPWTWESVELHTNIDVNNYRGNGILQLKYKYSGECPLSIIPETKQLCWLELNNINCENLCVSFKNASCFCPQFVGAKGASLALLSSVDTKRYQVPNGFCLSVKAMERHLQSNPIILESIKSIEKINENYSETELKKYCEITSKLLCETELEKSVKKELEIYFIELSKSNELDNNYFAVRSSGIGEDSEELSAAGQNSSILGCKTLEDICCAVQKCWASLFSFQSVEYRRQHGQSLNSGMGVVVQIMVDASAAGVMFTRHPSSGNPDCILITSNYGLGETVVSGLVEPDHIYIGRDENNDIKIEKIEIGNKSLKMCLNKSLEKNSSSINSINLEEKSKTASINKEECIALGKIAIEQEILWGSARDIEWAISKGNIYLVQARPITTLQSWTEYELLHELDSPVMSEFDMTTFANTGEVLPSVISPLSHSAVANLLNHSLIESCNVKPMKYAWTIFSSTHYRIAINVLNTTLKNMEKDISMSNKVGDMTIFGHTVTNEKIHSIALHRNGALGNLGKIKLLLTMIKMIWQKENIKDRAKIISNKFSINLENCESLIEMYERINFNHPDYFSVCNCHNMCSSASYFTQFLFFSILLEGKHDFTLENYTDIGTVLSSCSNVVSGEVPEYLKNIAKSIEKSKKSGVFCQLNPEDGVQWLKDNCPNIYDHFQTFLKHHGHRSIFEFDMMTDTWELNPTSLIVALQTTLLSPLKEEQIKDKNEIISRLKSPMKNITRRILKIIIPSCQKAVACREGTKAALTLFIHKFRLAVRKLAKEMTKEWLLPDEKLIYFFTNSELKHFIKSRNPGLINKAMLRKRYFPKWSTYKFAEINFGPPKPINIENIKVNESGEHPIVYGTPVFPGSVVGRACVVHNLPEVKNLKNGDILITHSTDIGWSPYFPLLGGVVTELGGLISHGAVVAREYGLPCIVGAQNATSHFITGDTVILDASKGLLQKCETQ